jgi:hypothetical protein
MSRFTRANSAFRARIWAWMALIWLADCAQAGELPSSAVAASKAPRKV